MPSPFPGMDPFLEGPAVFPDFQRSLVATLSTALNRVLPEPYYAALANRAWLDRDEFLPATSVLPPVTSIADGEVVQPVVVELGWEEFAESFLQVLSSPAGEHVVARIEVLSPFNKQSGHPARDLYLEMQREIMDTQVHFVEIDLLRGGEHTSAPPRWRIERKAGLFHYHVSLHRYDKSLDCVVYPIPLPARLPKLPIPLLPGDGEVMIDLQAAVDRCYDTGLYSRRVEYRPDRLTPPLAPEYQEWAANILARKAGGQPA